MLTRDNIELIKQVKTKMIHFAWDRNYNSDIIIKNLELFKAETGIDRRKTSVYVLTNFDSSFDFDLYRVEILRKLGYDPYIMVYDKPNAPQNVCYLQRWVNNKVIWRRCDSFAEFDPRVG